MATPSSSTTTPSPRVRYLQSSGNASTFAVVQNGILANEGEDREQLAQKITADAHLGELALSLRARLLYANFKVKSNTANHTLHELDSQLTTAGKHTPNGKRVAHYFNEPGSPTSNALAGGQSSRSGVRKGSMAPPPPVTASAAQSLFSSLLAPPPAKRARTIHNPDEPPVAAPEKVVEQVRSPMRPAKVTRTPDTHAKSKSKRAAKEKGNAPSSAKGKGKGKQRVTAEGSFEAAENTVQEREIDMQAAATLTTLLLNQQRPSISGTAGSPRSSISAGSDAGSTHSFAHYAQSSTRTAARGGGTPVPSSQQSLFGRAARSTATPPHSPAMSQASPAMSQARARRSSVTQGSNLRPEGAGTPKTTPRDRVDDTDAADMLLLMATSPSPARPSTSRDRDARDAAAFRALRGGGSGLKGRVLFPSYGGDEGGDGTSRTLSREMSGSFASVSSTATEPVSPRTMPMRREAVYSQPPSRLSTVQDLSQIDSSGNVDVPMLPTITPPTPTDPVPSHLLPSAVSSPQQHPDRSPDRPNGQSPFPAAISSQTQAFLPPRTPNASFSLSDYVNVSPSPATSASRTVSGLAPQGGRRLFKEHHSSTPPPKSSGHP